MKSPEERAGEWIARAMAMAQVNQMALAARAGMSNVTVCNAVNSKHDIKVSTLIRLIENCGLECELILRPRND